MSEINWATAIVNDPTLLSKCPKSLKTPELTNYILYHNPLMIITHTLKHITSDHWILAILTDPTIMDNVPPKYISPATWNILVAEAPSIAFHYRPPQHISNKLHYAKQECTEMSTTLSNSYEVTRYNSQKLWDIAIITNPYLVLRCPKEYIRSDLWQLAICQKPYLLYSCPEEYITDEIRTKAMEYINNNSRWAKN
jgi:hypothetical protein